MIQWIKWRAQGKDLAHTCTSGFWSKHKATWWAEKHSWQLKLEQLAATKRISLHILYLNHKISLNDGKLKHCQNQQTYIYKGIHRTKWLGYWPSQTWQLQYKITVYERTNVGFHRNNNKTFSSLLLKVGDDICHTFIWKNLEHESVKIYFSCGLWVF